MHSSSETPARGRSLFSRKIRSFSAAACRSGKSTGGGANARRLMASASNIWRPRICSITDLCAGDNASALRIILQSVLPHRPVLQMADRNNCMLNRPTEQSVCGCPRSGFSDLGGTAASRFPLQKITLRRRTIANRRRAQKPAVGLHEPPANTSLRRWSADP